MPLSLLSLSFAAYVQTAEKKVMAFVLPVVDGMIGVTACSRMNPAATSGSGWYSPSPERSNTRICWA